MSAVQPARTESEKPALHALDSLPEPTQQQLSEQPLEAALKPKLLSQDVPQEFERPPEMEQLSNQRRSLLLDLAIVEVILGHREYFFASIRDRQEIWLKIRAMVVSCFAFFGIYGAVMGASQSPLQAISAAVKLPVLFIITFCVCAPSLYFINKFFSSTQRLSQYIALILSAMTIMAILLVSFAPVTFFFLVTGGSYPFFKLLNVLFFGVAGILSLVFLRRGIVATRDPHNREGMMERRYLFIVWVVLYVFVDTQLAWTLSPFMGDPSKPFMVFSVGGNFYSDVVQSLRKLLGQ